jgi:hypothetical protein
MEVCFHVLPMALGVEGEVLCNRHIHCPAKRVVFDDSTTHCSLHGHLEVEAAIDWSWKTYYVFAEVLHPGMKAVLIKLGIAGLGVMVLEILVGAMEAEDLNSTHL